MSQAKRKLAAIMAADVAGYSRLMGADEEGTVAALDACRTIFRSTIEHHDGRVVDTAGDSVLATFDSVVEAVRCSVELQGTLSARDADLADDRRMQFRIGVNLGDVITKGDGTIYGDGVNVAARLESLAEPGGIAVSGTVFDHAENKLPVAFEFIGEHEVKNIAKPVQVYRVRDNVDEDSQTFAATNSTTTDDPVLAMPTGPTIAILPFTNMSSDPEQEYFSDGITEEIITELARFQTLHVLARNSTFQYKGKAVDVRSVGKELGARYVVEGSIRRAADTIRVTAQLLDVNDGTHLWADTFERKLTANNIFEVQDEVTQKIVAVIGDSYGIISAVALQDRSSRRAESIDAYQCVLAAREFYASPTPKKHLDVRAGLERAVELAPSYADAWAWLAAIYREEHSSGFNPRPGSLDRAEKAASRAIELDQRNQEAHLVLAHVYFFRHQLEPARIQAERTIALNPNSPDVLASLSYTIALGGNWSRGVAMAEKAIILTRDPPKWMYWAPLWNHYRKGEYDDALAGAHRATMPGLYYTCVNLAMIYGQMGRTNEAKAELDKLLELVPEFPEKARELLPWMGQGEFLDLVIDGLQKAGLDIK